MNIAAVRQFLLDGLVTRYDKSEANAITDLYFEHITGQDRRSGLLCDVNVLVDDVSVNQQISRLIHGEPLQYVINQAWFYHLKLYVDSSVLIPRPETEELVHWIVEDLGKEYPELMIKNSTEADATRTMKVMDVGTGSGCIALAIKNNAPLAEVWGCDVSADALTVARRNASSLDIRVDFQQVNFLDETERKQLPTVDILVSNPPYIPENDRNGMSDNVLNYEPHLALFPQGDDPLIFYRLLIEHAKSRLSLTGKIYVETHFETAATVESLFQQNGFETTLKKDMQGKDRMIKASRI